MDASSLQPLLAGVEGLLNLLLFGFLLLVLLQQREGVRRRWRAGLGVALLVLLLDLPRLLVHALCLDVEHLRALAGLPALAAPQGPLPWPVLALLAGLGTSALQAGWVGLLGCAALAEWEHLRAGRGVLSGRRALLGAAGAGLLLGFAAGFAFAALGVGAGPAMEPIEACLPALASAERAPWLAVALPVALGAALGEELIFRGALLGWALRRARGRAWGTALAVAGVTLAWSLLHLTATDAPLLKLAEIAPLGLLLAEAARRWGLGAAVAAHLAFNAAGVAASFSLAP